MDYLRSQPFFYTLTPPGSATQPVDEFLFDTREGFCEHYASAFTLMMRAAGLPARVVTGYQGGELNGVGGYYIIRQSDAHAWTEVWLEDEGWVRVDPRLRGRAGAGCARLVAQRARGRARCRAAPSAALELGAPRAARLGRGRDLLERVGRGLRAELQRALLDSLGLRRRRGHRNAGRRSCCRRVSSDARGAHSC